MKDYEVIQTLSLATGFVGLTTQQAGPRIHNLKATKTSGIYQILAPIQFKIGEVIRLEPKEKDRYIEMRTKEIPKAVSDDVKKSNSK